MNPLGLDPTSRLVVQTVLRHGPIPRAAIARRTGLSSGSLTRLTAPLVEAGYLREGDSRRARVGRPSLPLEVVDPSAYFLGVKIVTGGIHAVVTGLGGQVHESLSRAVDTSSAASATEAIRELVTELLPVWPIVALGASLAAVVDEAGTIRAAGLLGWRSGDNLRALLGRSTGLPCVTANDVDALTLSEHWLGWGRGTHDFAVLTVGAGVGAGAIVSDELVVGHQGSAVMLSRAWTRDGRRFDDVLTTGAFTAALRARGRDEALSEAVDTLGQLAALASLAYGPERMLITGEGLAQLIDQLDAVGAAMRHHRGSELDPPELVAKDLDFADWARGAAALAIHRCLAL